LEQTVGYPKTGKSHPKNTEGAKVNTVELIYKGRVVSKLAQDAEKKDWHEFTKCRYENPANPERVHVAPLDTFTCAKAYQLTMLGENNSRARLMKSCAKNTRGQHCEGNHDYAHTKYKESKVNHK